MLKIDELDKNDLKLVNYKSIIDSLDKFAITRGIYKDNELIGFVILDRVGQMNEYKLGKLYIELFNKEDYELIHDEFDSLLDYFINKEFYLKIVINVLNEDDNKLSFIEKHNFVLNKENEDNKEYKITKPIYLERKKK